LHGTWDREKLKWRTHEGEITEGHFFSLFSGRSLEIAGREHGAGIRVWKFAVQLAVRCPFLLLEFFL
jgi:hypothetical protein